MTTTITIIVILAMLWLAWPRTPRIKPRPSPMNGPTDDELKQMVDRMTQDAVDRAVHNACVKLLLYGRYGNAVLVNEPDSNYGKGFVETALGEIVVKEKP